MADDTIITQEVAVDPQVAAKAELDQLMALQFGKIAPPVEQPADVPRETSVEPATNVEPPAPVEFKFEPFKEKFGYTSPDEVLADIEALRTKVATPVAAPELKFENEASEKLYNAIIGGKQKEVAAILAEQDRLESLTSVEVSEDTAADIIKMGMQLKYKSLTKELIEHKFNKQFAIPKEPVFNEDTEDETEFKARHAEWKEKVLDIKMDKLMEAAIYKPELEAAKSKLVLPDINKNVDQDYLDWKKEQEEASTTNAQVLEAYKAFRNEDVKYEQDFIDEPNKINTKLQYVPSPEAFRKAQEMVTDMDKFYAMYKNSDGSPNRKAFIADIAILVDKKAFVAAAMNQAKNATLKRELSDNGAGGLTRQLVELQPGEPSELEKAMALNGITRRVQS